MTKQLLSVREVCERLNASNQQIVLKAIHCGDLKATNIGGPKRPTWRIPIESLEAFVAMRMHRPAQTKRSRRNLPAIPEYV